MEMPTVPRSILINFDDDQSSASATSFCVSRSASRA